jgi:hypothetical protein
MCFDARRIEQISDKTAIFLLTSRIESDVLVDGSLWRRGWHSFARGPDGSVVPAWWPAAGKERDSD